MSCTPEAVVEPTTGKVHGNTEEVVGKLSPFVFTGSRLGSLSWLERGDARGREKNGKTHRSMRRTVKSKVGTDHSSPPSKVAMGTDDGGDSETSIEGSSWALFAASFRERLRSGFQR
ncbi:hypothetical protein KM043_016620 [Ampulex compressa]|nr:hypothetical protein KM043_016620 [Ampulex compressa]